MAVSDSAIVPARRSLQALGVRTHIDRCLILVLAALAMVATLPGRTHGLGMITERLLADPLFGLDRISYSDMNLWATLLGGLFCLPCGWLIDRFGLRINLAVTVAALGAVVLWMTHLTGSTLLFAAILLTRGFGQSALSVISITMVGKWYPGRPSFPMAVYTLLLSLGFAYSAQWAKPYAASDWRVVWGGMGWILLLGMLPLALLTPSARREREFAAGHARARTTMATGGFTLQQALRTQAFWVFGLAISLIALIGSGQSLFNESVLEQQGFSKEVFYNLITFTGLVGLVVKLPIGWIGRYCPLNYLLAAGMTLLSICLIGLPFIHTDSGITAYGVGMGVSGTITTILFFTIWSQAYGQAHLGKIQATAQMLTVLASAAGPKVFAECFTRYGSYAPAFQLLAAIVAGLAVWSLLIRVPSPDEAPQDSPVPLSLAVPQES